MSTNNIGFGLLGERLSHSYSAEIHPLLQKYDYTLFEVKPEDLESFILYGKWEGINVTIPYKKAIMPYLDYISPIAENAGSVNTIVKTGGKLYGYNTDVFGFRAMLCFYDIDLRGKKVIILGSGGAACGVHTAIKDIASEVIIISRTGGNSYNNIYRHYNADIIINATPVGMYPNFDEGIIDIEKFKRCEAYIDLIYNPLLTYTGAMAKYSGIKAIGGLYMLVAQALKSGELFCNEPICNRENIDRIYNMLLHRKQNIVLIGMPGVGKTTYGKKLAEQSGREFVDTDGEFYKAFGIAAGEYITKYGELSFRDKEGEIIRSLSHKTGCVIATGGGVVLREENYFNLKQNGKIVYLKRDISSLDTANRPLSADLKGLYRLRAPLYEKFADEVVEL